MRFKAKTNPKNFSLQTLLDTPSHPPPHHSTLPKKPRHVPNATNTTLPISTRLMDLADSTHHQARSASTINLNAIPSSSSSSAYSLSPDDFAVFRTFHDHPPSSSGPPAHVPGDASGSGCAACGRPEVGGDVVVCDGCERGFHLGCAGMRGRQVVVLDEWICRECVSDGVPINRWALGLKSSLHSDGEGHGSEEFSDSRCDNSFGAPVTYSNSLYVGKGFGFQKSSGIVTLGVKDILHHTYSVVRGFEEADMQSLLGSVRSSNHTATRQAPQNPNEMHLQALNEFISERHGVLEEGWCVEFKRSMGNGELHAVYCAPDGKTFDSMPEVACHLGLMSNSNSEEPKNGCASLQRSHLAKGRKSAVLSMANSLSENNKILSGLGKDLSSDFNTMGCASKFENNVEVVGAMPKEISGTGPQQFNEGLPVQYGDFFVLSLGKVDTKLSYHNGNQIWPVGYKSCWHDKITGSIFICDVSDGGGSGPIFKVSRCSCSIMSMPNGSTVLFTPNVGQLVCENKKNDYDEYCSVQILLTDASSPMENDILLCPGSSSDKSFSVQTSNCLLLGSDPFSEGFRNVLPNTSVLSEEIGEFSVEESSSSSAWRMVSKKFVDACRQIFMQRGTLKLFCEHVENGTSLTFCDHIDEKDEGHTSLARFFGSSCSIKIPSVIQDDSELDTVFKVLAKWLDQDRFGLDVEFVQEIIEQLPGVPACSQYVFLAERSGHSSFVTVGNGLLLVKTKDGIQAKDEEALDGLFRGCRRARTEMVEDPVLESPHPPPGKPICSKLPSEIVGDVLQVWEFLWRFYEVLGLQNSLSIEELEEELICPWFDGLTLLERFGEKIQESHDIISPRTDGLSEPIVTSCAESGSAVTTETLRTLIEMQTKVMKETTQAIRESVTNSSCMGIALAKTFCSLLKVLVGELQSKVAPEIDSNFDSGGSKLKRGKKKAMDCSVSTKGTKLNTLPINELTWPELARRYILAVSSMDGNVDSPGIVAHESGKVFCCLQGDGGVLCGSLTGVVGMEADALLLAQAGKKIFGSLNRENDMLSIDDGGSDATSACESYANIPEWVQLLEPVRKLPTNVGARIRKCVYSALEKGPPDWAKKILEHSISKEVYKGNASGPTKKAVLSVLANAYGEGMQQKPDTERNKKDFVSISDMIMKQCRVVLRCVVAADKAKNLNLVGRNLMSCSDRDDKGILGSPAMVSRPLDFRTIDLRLAVGAYGGSHEAFFEDVQELWTNMRIAFVDEPDLNQLVETLSSNFKGLYEKEVVCLFQKFVRYNKLGCLTAESKIEIDDFLVSLSQLPKAPWEEGVCKVCGIDKDDKSVLLCDTCDAEYHTYCLHPPLARVPQGNWYCPSCVANKHNVRDALECTPTICHNRRKYHREVTHVYLDKVKHLASVLEEKEYWEFSVDERMFLLKFLCDELLNTDLIRQHLEDCVELSADLKKKLRSVSIECGNLKYKEQTLAAKIAKMDKCPSFSNNLEKSAGNSLTTEPLDAEDRYKDVQAIVEGSQLSGYFSCCTINLERDKSFRQKELLPSNLQQEIKDSTLPFPEDLQGIHSPLNMRSSLIVEHKPSPTLSKLQTDILELNSVRNQISLLQESICSMEMQLMKISVRREFLGCDSAGRLYWVLAKLGRHPWVIVNTLNSGEMTLQQGVKISSGSRGSFPYVHELNDVNTLCFPWVSYQSEAEIKELAGFLRDDDTKERELKESIVHLLKLKYQDSKQTEKQGQGEPLMASSGATNREFFLFSKSLITKATSLLKKKYDPQFEPETSEFSGVFFEDKFFRCNCLEPVWSSRHHCLTCHKTFLTEVQLKGHNNAMCKLGLADSKKSKGNSALKGKGMMKSETLREERTGEMDVVQESKSGNFEFNSKLIKYQNDGLLCPFDFEEICSKFVTKNSIEELVQEIGLLGSNGVPLFVPSVSPYPSDPTLMLASPKRDVDVSCKEPKTDEQLTFTQQGIRVTIDAGLDISSSSRRCAANELAGAFKSDNPVFESMGQKDENSSFFSRAPAPEVGNCCVIPEAALRPLVGKASQFLRVLKINLLDMDGAIPEAALRPSKAHLERRWAWRAFVKSAETIYEMVQAVIVFEDMIKMDYLRNMWWYWSSLTAAAKIHTLSSLALRIYSLDAAIDYEKNSSNLDEPKLASKTDQKARSVSHATEKSKPRGKVKRKRAD
ncbi:unnamed protein product [Camellia sinensis]